MVNRARIDSLEELRTFVAIVDEGSLAAAARSLEITANAVSRRLSLLEERLGLRLIHRTTRRLSLSDEGHRFHGRCVRILEEAGEAERELLQSEGKVAGVLRVSIHPDMVCKGLMTSVANILSDWPELEIKMQVSNQFLDPIDAGLDLSIHVGRPADSSLVAVPLGEVVWSLAASPLYLDRCGLVRRPEQLAGHECLRVLRASRETHWLLSKKNSEKERFPIGGRFETTDSRALVEALFAGIGIGVRLRSEIKVAQREGTLKQVLPHWRWASTPVFALLPKGRTKIPAVKLMLSALRSSMKDR